MKTFDDMWEQVHSEMEWGKYPSEEVIRFVARNYYKKDRENVNLLDFGCGTERFHGIWRERDLILMVLMGLKLQ